MQEVSERQPTGRTANPKKAAQIGVGGTSIRIAAYPFAKYL
jgi:hypothetical protein